MTTAKWFTNGKLRKTLKGCPDCLEGIRNYRINDYELEKQGFLTRKDYADWLLFEKFFDAYIDCFLTDFHCWDDLRKEFKDFIEDLRNPRYKRTLEVLDGRDAELKDFSEDVIFTAVDDDEDWIILRPEDFEGLNKPPEYYIDYLLKNWKQLYKRWLPFYLKKAEMITEIPLIFT